MAKRSATILIPAIAIACGFILGALVVLFTGRNPLAMFQAMLQGMSGINLKSGSFNPRYIGEFILQALPIVLTGLSVGFAFRTGLFNVGAEGQLMAGSMGAMAVALGVTAPPIIHAVLVLVGAMVCGGIWGAVPGFLKARFNVHEVVVTIMMNYTALYLNNWLIISVFGSADRVKTPEFPLTAMLKDPMLSAITNGSRLNWGFIPVIMALFIFWFVIERTSFGYSLRAVGFNRDGAQYAGIKVNRNIISSMIISGAFAGLAGAVITVGTFSFGRTLPAMEGYGMDGIAVALVGGNTAVGIAISGLLFGMLKAAQPLMQSQGIPKTIATIIQSSIVLFIAMKYGIVWLIGKLRRDKPAEESAEAGT